MQKTRLSTYILRSSTIIMGGTILAHLLNYSFNLYTAHTFSPEQYAILITMISIISIINIPSYAITTIATTFTAKLLPRYKTSTAKNILAASAPLTFLAGTLFAITYLTLVPILSRTLTIPLNAFLLLLPIIFLSPALQANIGILQGIQKFHLFSGVSVIESGIKLLLVLFFGFFGWTLYGALGAICAAILGGYIISSFFIFTQKNRSTPEKTLTKNALQEWKRSSAVILATTIALSILTNIDILLAKYFLPVEIAAQYSALMVISRVIGYGSFIIIPVFFPVMAQSTDKRRTWEVFIKGFKITAGISLGLIALFFLFPDLIVAVLVGNKYAPIAPYIAYGGMVSGLHAIAQLCIYYFISIRSEGFLVPLIAAIFGEITALIFFNHSITHFLTITFAASAIIVASFLILSWSSHKPYAK